jgi:hypothetical protein
MSCIIKLNSPNNIIFDDKKCKKIINDDNDLINDSNNIHIGKDIYDKSSNVVIGSKKSYLLYHGSNYDLMGYCHALSFAIDVIKSRISSLIIEKNKYEVHIKKVKIGTKYEYKFYLYQLNEGWIYNGYTLLDKFKIVEIPKIELKYSDLPLI